MSPLRKYSVRGHPASAGEGWDIRNRLIDAPQSIGAVEDRGKAEEEAEKQCQELAEHTRRSESAGFD